MQHSGRMCRFFTQRNAAGRHTCEKGLKTRGADNRDQPQRTEVTF